MDRWRSLADRKIQEAMDQGEFLNLRGQGQPQRLERNPYEPPELRMAHMVLEGAGLSPAWILERKDLDRDVELARGRLVEAAGGPEWPAAAETFRTQAVELNRRILTHNLRVPSAVFQRRQLDAEFEIARIGEAGQVIT